MKEIQEAIRKHIANYVNETHDDCAICIAYRLGLEAAKPF